jgi:hypothetical protein
MGSTFSTKRLTTVAVVLVVAFLGYHSLQAAVYLWHESQIPKKASIASIERSYRSQLERLAEYAYDYDRFSPHGRPEGKDVARLFANPAIVEATVHCSDSFGGFGVKCDELPDHRSCSCYFSPSIGEPVVNLWSDGDRQFIEYRACLLDRRGVMRSYTIMFDPSKMLETDE